MLLQLQGTTHERTLGPLILTRSFFFEVESLPPPSDKNMIYYAKKTQTSMGKTELKDFFSFSTPPSLSLSNHQLSFILQINVGRRVTGKHLSA